MSKETFDPTIRNKSQNRPFSDVLNKHASRRSILKSGAGFAGLSMLSGMGIASLTGCGSDSKSDKGPVQSSVKLGFDSIAGSKTDAVVVPPGYSAQVLAAWGEPLNDTASDFDSSAEISSTSQNNAMGMHHDGMHFFPIDGSSEDGLLCVNHEYLDQKALHLNGATKQTPTAGRPAEEVRKEIAAHGVSVVRVKKGSDGQWAIVKNDPLNRRYTGETEMEIRGPLRGSSKLATKYSANGTKARGTLNNCGNGISPWGTYLTNEENWPGYFVTDGTKTVQADAKRLGLSQKLSQFDNKGALVRKTGSRYGWETAAGAEDEQNDEFTRFNNTPSGEDATKDYRNEARGHGYITEIDPYTNSKAQKRTSLGRFRHECSVYGKLTKGEPVVFYSGHDGRFEYIYKFVSDAKWDPADANPSDRLKTGNKYLDKGSLYAAKFEDDGKGQWILLDPDTPIAGGLTLSDKVGSMEDIILNTPQAADEVGATPMDRPEWATVDPFTGSVYFTLTNNTKRTDSTNPANPRLNNAFGHIIRWDEKDDNTFEWDIFVFGSAQGQAEAVNRSGLTEMNQFASPDGLLFDPRGILWVQTDNGASEVTSYTNDQMLAVVPSKMRTDDGKQAVINSNNQDALRRFFVGPNGCEVTGITYTPDYKTIMVNIQHPGNWPQTSDAALATNGTVRPRAATVVITKDDGGLIGE